MLNQLSQNILLNTIVEADIELNHWAQRLTADRGLELGDDPQLIGEVERDFDRLAHKIRLLKPQFELSRVPLRQANNYFAATRHIDQTLTLVRDIRRHARGSQQNTNKCLTLIELCIVSVRQVSDLAKPLSQIKH